MEPHTNAVKFNLFTTCSLLIHRVRITAYPETPASSGNPLIGVDWVINQPSDLQELGRAVTKLLPKP
jgi:hypothetical protein